MSGLKQQTSHANHIGGYKIIHNMLMQLRCYPWRVYFHNYSASLLALIDHATISFSFLAESNPRFTSYLNSEILSHHAVPGCQISMDKLVSVEVSHAISDLPCHLKHLLQGRERQARPLLL